MKKITAFLLFIFSSLQLFPQGDSLLPILGDRPLQSETPHLLLKGNFQVESGAVFFDRSDDSGEQSHLKLAATLLRYGVFDHFEVRIGGGWEWVEARPNEAIPDSGYSGLGPVSAGFKVFIAEEKGWRPRMAINGNIVLRHIGNKYLRPTFSYPLGKIICRHTLSKKFSLGYHAGFAWNGENADGFFIYSANAGYNFSKKFMLFAEAYGTFDSGNLPNHSGSVGLVWYAGNNLQVDLSSGLGFSKRVDKYSIGAGLSWRFPK